MEFRYQSGESVQIERRADSYMILIEDRVYTVHLNEIKSDEVTFTLDSQRLHAYLAEDGQQRYIAFDADVHTLVKNEGIRRKRATGAGENNLTASMPGQVVRVLVKEGNEVKRGETLVLLEAMKMEIRVTAPHHGKVAKIMCAAGQIMERGQALLELIGD
jgi:biotin carboxyl carrier protein